MKLPDGYISLREWTRRFEPSLNALQKAIADGRVTSVLRKPDGTCYGVHYTHAWDEYLRNTDPVAAAKNGKLYAPTACTAEASTPGVQSAPRASLSGVEGRASGPPDAVTTSASPAARSASRSEAEQTESEAGRAGNSSSSEKPVAGSQPATDEAAQLELGGGAPGRVPAEPGFADFRAKREKYQAEQAELEYLRAIGRTVWAEDVEREYLEIMKQVKANVLRGNSKMAVLIAAETDPAKVERMLNEADNKVFDELSRTFAADATEGAEERTAAAA